MKLRLTSINAVKPRRNRTNKEKTAGLLDVVLELRFSKFTSFEPK